MRPGNQLLSLFGLISLAGVVSAQYQTLPLSCFAPSFPAKTGSTYITNDINDPTQCATECAQSTGDHPATQYSYWRAHDPDDLDIPVCVCSNLGGAAENVDVATSNQMDCSDADNDWWVFKPASTYRFSGCFDNFDDPSDTQTSIEYFDTPNDCLDYCSAYPAMVMTAGDNGFDGTQWRCICGAANVVGTPTSEANCDMGVYQVYSHSAEATYCPAPKRPCNIVGTSSFECIDTSSELESCGGCAYGQYGNTTAPLGTDCSLLPGTRMGGSTCTKGVCQVSACRDGWTLNKKSGKCVRALNVKKRR